MVWWSCVRIENTSDSMHRFYWKKWLFLEYHSSLSHGKSGVKRRSGSEIGKQIFPKVNMSKIGENAAKRRWNAKSNCHLIESGWENEKRLFVNDIFGFQLFQCFLWSISFKKSTSRWIMRFKNHFYCMEKRINSLQKR